MKYLFKKIGSILASTAMLTSTVALAAAASYPAPFVSSAGSDVAIVHGGSNAAYTDLVAVTDISTQLSTELAKLTAKGGTTTSGSVSGGDSYALYTSSTPIQLNTSISAVRSSVTSNNLPILADSDFTATSDSTDDSSITVSHKIEVGANPRAVFAKEPTSNDDPTAGILLGTTAATHLYNASATFSKDVNFTDTDSKGDTIDLFGKRFTIASATDSTNLVLFESATKISLSDLDPTAEATINGKTFTIELVSASDSSATVKIVDSAGTSDQKEINEAASKKILGVEVAVDTADETAAGKISATVILGASRLKFTSGSEVLKGTEEDPIEGTQVNFQGTVPDMKKLSVAVFATSGSDDFFKAGNSYIDPVFGGAFKLDFVGLASDKDREDIKVDVSGNDKMIISFTNWQGKELSNFGWLNNETRSMLADASDWPLMVKESGIINKSAYTVVGNEDEAYLIRLQSLSNVSGTVGQASEYNNDIIKFQNMFDTAQTWEADITAEGTGTIDIGGKTFTVSYKDDRAGNNDAFVQLNHPDSSANEIIAFPTIETGRGAKLIFYEPLLINLSDAHEIGARSGGAWANVTAIKIPDGDGYTDFTVTAETANPAAQPFVYAITVGSTITNLTTNATSSVDGSSGPLKWNLSTGSTGPNGRVVVNHTAWLRLEDVDGTVINTPAIVLIEEQDEDNNYNAVIVKTSGAGNSDNGIGVSDIDFTWNGDLTMGASGGGAYGATGLQGQTNDKWYYMMDRWGTLVTTDQTTSDQYTSTISYPNGQVTAEVYVSGAGTTITGGATTSTGATSLGSVSVTDAEVSSVGSKNLIVVGGSCVNTEAARLLGFSGKGCGSDFTAKTGVGSGQFLIETFSRSTGKVATLVAGFNAGDTTNAAKYLTTQSGIMTESGKKYIGTSSTSATLQTKSA